MANIVDDFNEIGLDKTRFPNPTPPARNMRQAERRLFFTHIFAQMPLWEVWDLPPLEGVAVVDGVSGRRLPHQDFKLIPRRLRRQMARVRAKREWRVAKGLAEPEKQHPPHITELPDSMYVNSHNYPQGE